MSFETKFLTMCRTCLTENTNMRPMFSTEEILEQPMLLSDVLMSFTSIQVLKGDGLPEQVCTNCVQEMSRAFLFRKLCEKSDNTLRNCIVQTLLPLPIDSDNLNLCVNKDGDRECIEEQINLKNEVLGNNEQLQIIEEDEDDKLDIDLEDSFQASDSEESDDDSYEAKKKVRKKKTTTSLGFEQKKKMYPCKMCEHICLGLAQYRRHVSEYHTELYKCDTCGKEFKSEAVLSRHVLSHSSMIENDENYRTEPKSKSYKNKTGITKKRNLPRTCNICNKTFRFHSNLERHKLIHTGEKPYLCNVCGKGFAQLSYLKIHSFIHTGEKPYKCKMCEKSFAAPGTLMTHIRTHTGERPHICKICGKDFPQSGYLSAHIRTHTGEKPVECKVCHRRFNQSGRLIIHMRIHSGEKPYNCMECGRSFAVKGTLKKHIRTHTGERPYICSVCGQAFAQSGTLATHMKVHKPKSIVSVN